MVNSIAKGKRFEREAAKLLSSTTQVPWHRTPCSGAMSTTQKIKNKAFKGDVFTEHPNYTMVVECKSINHFLLPSLFSQKSLAWQWICKLEADFATWALLVKVRQSGILAISPYTDVLKSLFPKHVWNHMILIDAKYAMIKIK